MSDEDRPDVDSASSTETTEPVVPPSPGGSPAGVSDDGVVVEGRPLRNWQAEADRKLGRMENTIADLVAVLQRMTSGSPGPAATVPARGEPTDDELAQQAAMGDAKALLALQTRIAERAVSRRDEVAQATNLVTSQLSVLLGKYPGIRDPNHPFRAAVLQAKATLLGLGYGDNRMTELEAIKVAIADDPELARTAMAPPSSTPTSAGGSSRPASSSTGSTELGGVTSRRPPTRATTPPGLTDAQWEIAKRTGRYKTRADAAQALKRFEDRNSKGRSGLTPNVATIIREQEHA